jgi:anaerobic magnesium-protoporphyrin IX monomethyl ester cyclase
MTHIDTYFEKYSKKDIEAFHARYRSFKHLADPKTDDFLTVGRLFQVFGLIRWAIDAFSESIQVATDRRERIKAYDAMTGLYRQEGLFYSESFYLEQAMKGTGTRQFELRLQYLKSTFPAFSVSCYLPCYNQEKYIAMAIEGLRKQSYPISEIMIIDDGSTDDSIKIAQQYPVRIIKHPSNLGLSAARNTAIENAQGDFIASVDMDVIPDRFWLEYMMLEIGDDCLAAVGGRLVEQNTVTVTDRWRQLILKQDNGENKAENLPIYGSNNVFRVSGLREVGGYDVRLRTNFEDMDMCRKLIAKGFKILHAPRAVCFHQRIDSLQSVVDTCYNWRKPVYELSGAFRDIAKLSIKAQSDLNDNLTDLVKLINSKRFDCLYPSFLSAVRVLFKDLERFKFEDTTSSRKKTTQAAYIYLQHLLVQSQKVNAVTIEFLLSDLADLICKNLEISKDQLVELNVELKKTLAVNSDINSILQSYSLIEDVDLGYVSEAFTPLLQLCGFDPIVYQMLAASARRIRYENENSPYIADNRIMIINPPWKVNSRRGVRAGSRWPFTGVSCAENNMEYTPYPFFMGYLASVLKQRGISAVVVDGVAENLSNFEFLERVAGYAPRIIVMETSTASYIVDNLWLLLLKERLPDATIIWTGPHVSALGTSVLDENSFVDFIIKGEYEIAAADLIAGMVQNKDYTHIKGLIYRNDRGEITSNGHSEQIDINTLPLPERVTVPIYNYSDLFAGMKYPCLQIHASRGCPFKCIYCVWPQVLYGNHKYRVRAPRMVVAEIKEAVDNFGFRSFYFDDDTFNIGNKRMISLCNEIKKYGLDKIPWGAMSRADTSDFETLKQLRDAGLVAMKFGVESGDQQLVDFAQKSLDLKKVQQTVQWCKALDIRVHLTFTFGLPEEQHHTIEKTISFAKELNPDSIQFSITTPFPGTRYYDILKSEGNLLSEDWEKYDGALYTVIKTKTMDQHELEDTVKRANSEYYRFKHKLINQCKAVQEQVVA